MRPLVIDQAALAEIRRVKEYAESHPFSLRDLLGLQAHPERAPGNDPAFTCHLQFGFKVVFTIEEQPAGKMRHISISVAAANRLPNAVVVFSIADQFGFGGPASDMNIYTEPEAQAVNVLQLVDPRSASSPALPLDKPQPKS